MDRRLSTAAAVITTAFAALAVYLFAFRTGVGRDLDGALLSAVLFPLGERGTGPLTMLVHTADSGPFILASLLVLWFAARRRGPLMALRAGAILAGANLTTQLLQPLLAQPRPHEAVIAAQAWPSGHATAAASLFVCVLMLTRRRSVRVAAGAWAFGVVACVMVLGWHFPSDALGGLLIVASWTGLALAPWPALERRRASGSTAASSVRPSQA